MLLKLKKNVPLQQIIMNENRHKNIETYSINCFYGGIYCSESVCFQKNFVENSKQSCRIVANVKILYELLNTCSDGR